MPPLFCQPVHVMVAFVAPHGAPLTLFSGLSMVIFTRLVAPVNALSSMVSMVFGMSIAVRLVQFWNAHLEIVVTFAGSVTASSAAHPAKHSSEMFCILSGKIISGSAVQYAKQP